MNTNFHMFNNFKQMLYMFMLDIVHQYHTLYLRILKIPFLFYRYRVI